MAITKIHAVKATVSKSIEYILDEKKTDEKMLVSTFGCGMETAAYDFQFSLSKTDPSDPNKAYHLIQSFLPGEVSFEEAHKIGTELADRLLEGKYSYVVATHIDKAHVHNHIIFCAADNIGHGKYNDCKKSYYRIRQLSDELCREHGLSVIIPSGQRGKKYNEWQAEQDGTSWKKQLRDTIDEAIQNAKTYEECIALIRAKGYEVQGESFGEHSPKYITFRYSGYKRFVRGSVKTLGRDYTKERIRERLDSKTKQIEQSHAPFPAKKRPLISDHSRRTLIDTTDKKFTDSPGLKHWADIQNLKIAASSYAETESIAALEDKIAVSRQGAKAARAAIVETEHRLKELGEIIKYAEQYAANKRYHLHYKKAKDRDAYLRKRETELLLFDGAEHMLRRFGINPKTMDLEQIKAEFLALDQKKSELQDAYKSAEMETDTLSRKFQNIQQFMEQNRPPEPEKEKTASQDTRQDR